MYSALTKEEEMQWRRSTEKITLEEFAQRLGKTLDVKKETNDLHDLFLRKQDSHEDLKEIKKVEKTEKTETIEKIEESSNAAKYTEAKPELKTETKIEEVEKQSKPDFEIKFSFKKKLNKREEVVLNYFCKNRKTKVSVKDLADVLGLPNDYVYKYIKNLRSKLVNDVLVNADKGGYILNV